MAEKKNQEAVIAVVGEKPAKKASVKKETVTEVAATETVVSAAPVADVKPAAKKAPAKKAAAKAKDPLYIDGRYVVEKQLPAKPAKGAKPYADAKKSVKVTLVKSTAGCLKKQQATVRALGLTKIRSSNILPDNAATRGMIFRVQHLVVVEEVK